VKAAVFHPDANQEAREAAARYEKLRTGLGADFRAEMRATLARIQNNPFAYAAESGSFRIAPLHRFPYSLIYEDLSDYIWIAAVAHHKRRPGYWARRRPG
jgi:hypothetical protein